MHEFTSISVSSYDAASLADKLTEKSAAGWDVVAIVPAGTNITAYLSREGGAAEAAPSWDATAVGDDTTEAVSSDDAPAEVATSSYVAEEVEAVEEPAPVWEPEPVAEEPAPAQEPAGWAVAPEPASPAPPSVGVAETSPEPTPYPNTSSGDTSSGYSTPETTEVPDTGYVGEPQLGSTTAGYDAGTTSYDTGTTGYDTGTSSGTTPVPNTGYDTAATTEPSAPTTDVGASSGYDTGEPATAATGYDAGATSEPAAGESAAGAGTEAASASTAEQATPATASAAPAGWYADPSGRYELRYWDGNQWTEHVSRAGQQYTDPPVA